MRTHTLSIINQNYSYSLAQQCKITLCCMVSSRQLQYRLNRWTCTATMNNNNTIIIIIINFSINLISNLKGYNTLQVCVHIHRCIQIHTHSHKNNICHDLNFNTRTLIFTFTCTTSPQLNLKDLFLFHVLYTKESVHVMKHGYLDAISLWCDLYTLF